MLTGADMELWRELLDWLRHLDPAFAFLLALPFVVGALGLLAHRSRRAPRTVAESRAHGAAGAHAR
ncbi:MAG TPA: hypothetical protein VF876_15815 [Burkholderiales bacterium]